MSIKVIQNSHLQLVLTDMIAPRTGPIANPTAEERLKNPSHNARVSGVVRSKTMMTPTDCLPAAPIPWRRRPPISEFMD